MGNEARIDIVSVNIHNRKDKLGYDVVVVLGPSGSTETFAAAEDFVNLVKEAVASVR